jgi:hypothetical protein
VVPLDDTAIQQFIVDGFHVVKPSDLTTLTPAFHRAVIDQADAAIAAGRPLGGNALLGEVPLLKELLTDPAVDGALTSLFGARWQLFQHSAMHDGGRAQGRGEQVSGPRLSAGLGAFNIYVMRICEKPNTTPVKK